MWVWVRWMWCSAQQCECDAQQETFHFSITGGKVSCWPAQHHQHQLDIISVSSESSARRQDHHHDLHHHGHYHDQQHDCDNHQFSPVVPIDNNSKLINLISFWITFVQMVCPCSFVEENRPRLWNIAFSPLSKHQLPKAGVREKSVQCFETGEDAESQQIPN